MHPYREPQRPAERLRALTRAGIQRSERSRRLRVGAALLAGATLLLLGARTARAESGHAHHAHHDHDALLEVSPQLPPPTVRLHAEPDPMGGWNLRLLTEHFRFAPERVNSAHVDGEGHAHLYVNGEKHARLYGAWFHLPALAPGEHLLRATLNANSHQTLAAAGAPIAAELRITQ